MPFRVATSLYDGPLDLLLHLVRQRELDVCDLTLAKVAGDFLAVVEAGEMDPDEAGEYLVVAATLVELKSGRLLPTPKREGADDGPAEAAGGIELVRRLLDYQKFRGLADELESLADEAAMRHGRPEIRATSKDRALDLDDLTVDLLHETFERLLSETDRRRPATHDVADDERPAAAIRGDVEWRLASGPATLRELLWAEPSRIRAIGVFLVVLEMLRDRRLSLSALGGDLTLRLVEGANDEGDDARRTEPEA